LKRQYLARLAVDDGPVAHAAAVEEDRNQLAAVLRALLEFFDLVAGRIGRFYVDVILVDITADQRQVAVRVVLM